MRVAAYYRVSSSQQRERHTIAGQRAEVRALVAARGWQLVAEHEDDGRSARKGLDKRTGLAAVLERVRARTVDAVIFVAFDRLSRSERIAERGAILGEFQDAGCKIIVSGGRLIDLSTFQGRLEAALLLELAAEESAEKSRRTKRGRVRAAQEGRSPGRAPYGYRCARGAWTTPQADVVREIYQRAATESCETIAGDLNRRGITSARGRRWRGCTVRDVVNPRRDNGDPYVTGLWFGQRGEPAITVPVIVTSEVAAAARAGIAERNHRPPTSTRSIYLLDEHAARCAICGDWIGIVGSNGRRRRDGTYTRFTYYGCVRRSHARAFGEAPCPLPYRRVEEVDARAWAAVLAALDEPLQVGSVAQRRGAVVAAATAEADAARAKAAEIASRLDALAGALADGHLSPEGYRAQAARLAKLRDGYAAQVTAWEAEQRRAEVPEVGAVERARVRWEIAERARKAGPAERRTLVRQLYPAWLLGDGWLEAILSGVGAREKKAQPERITRGLRVAL